MHLNKELDYKIIEFANLRQAIFWTAFEIPPIRSDDEISHDIPKSIIDLGYWSGSEYIDQEIDIATKRIWYALNDGKLNAEGRKSLKKNITNLKECSRALNHKEMLDNYFKNLTNNHPSYFSSEFEKIPNNYWSLEKINWENNQLYSFDYQSSFNKIIFILRLHALSESKSNLEEISYYGQIRIKFDELKKIFPIKKAKTTPTLKPKSKAGRDPQYKWDEIFEEVAKYIIRNPDCPQYQDKLNGEMQQWYNNKYKKEPVKSRMHDKLKPIFDEWKNNSE